MIFKLKLGKWKIVLTIAPVTQIVGVNSTLPDGKHILMWDFDDTEYKYVYASLFIVQSKYKLPNIYILNTGKPNNHIAYCFYRCDWREAIQIIASTKSVCLKFFKWSVYRGYFTLRVGPKYLRMPKLVGMLISETPPTASPLELHNFVKYLIFEEGYKNRVIVIPHGS